MKDDIAINSRASSLAAEIRPTTNLLQAELIVRMILENPRVVVAGSSEPQQERDIALATLSQLLNGSFGTIVEAEQRFAMHCILAVCERAPDKEIKREAVVIYVEFFEKQYAKPSIDESDQISAAKPLIMWLDKFSNFSFAAKATAAYLFTAMIQEKHEYRLISIIQRLHMRQLDMMTALVAVAAEENNHREVEKLLKPFIEQMIFLKSGLNVLEHFPKLQSVYVCLAQLNILITFLGCLNTDEQKQTNKKLVIKWMKKIIDNLPDPDEQQSKLKLYRCLKSLLRKYSQYYVSDTNKRQSEILVITQKNRTDDFISYIREPHEVKVLTAVRQRKNRLEQTLEADGMLVPEKVKAPPRMSRADANFQAFAHARTIEDRIDAAIQIYQDSLTRNEKELETACLNYLLMTMQQTREQLTPEYLKRQRLLYRIGHPYQGGRMPFLDDINKWLQTLSDKDLQENQVELQRQYRNKIIDALQKAIADGVILTLSNQKIEDECLVLLFKQLLRPLRYSEATTPDPSMLKLLLILGREIKLADLDLALLVQLQHYVKVHGNDPAKSGYVNFLKRLFDKKTISVGMDDDVIAGFIGKCSIYSCITLRELTYLNSHERMHYQVFVDSKGTLHKFDEESSSFVPASTTKYSTYNKAGWAAFVVTVFGEILVNSREDFLFNHASFVAGGLVLFSGELRIDDQGHIVGITNVSGHYLPQLDNLFHLFFWFEEISVDLSNCIFYLFDKAKYAKFIQNESTGESVSAGAVSPDKHNQQMLDVCLSVVDIRHLRTKHGPFLKIKTELNRLSRYLEIVLRNVALIHGPLREKLNDLRINCKKAVEMNCLRDINLLINNSVEEVLPVNVTSENFLTRKVKREIKAISENMIVTNFVTVMPRFVSPTEPFLYCENQLQKLLDELVDVVKKYFSELAYLLVPISPLPKKKKTYDLEFFSAVITELQTQLAVGDREELRRYIQKLLSFPLNSNRSLPADDRLQQLATDIFEAMDDSKFQDYKNAISSILKQMQVLCDFNFQERELLPYQNPIAENFRQCLFYASWDYYQNKPKGGMQERELRVIRDLFAILQNNFESLESFVGVVHQFLTNENNKLVDLMGCINKTLLQGFSGSSHKNLGDLKSVSDDPVFVYLVNKLLNPYRYVVDCPASFLLIADSGTYIQQRSEESLGGEKKDPQRNVADAMRAYMIENPEPRFVVHAGDNFYKLGVPNPKDKRLEEFERIYEELPPAYLVMGNHDHRRLRWDKVAFFRKALADRTNLTNDEADKLAKVEKKGLLDEYKTALGTPRKKISASQVEYTMRRLPMLKTDRLDGRAFYARPTIDLEYLERNNWRFNMPNLFYSIESNNAVLIFLDSNIFVKNFLQYMLKNGYIRKNKDRNNPTPINRIDNQVVWLLKLLEDYKDDKKPKILIWHHPLHPYSKRFKATDTPDFLQERHLQMLRSIGCNKTAYHEILEYVLIKIKEQLEIPVDVPLFTAVFSGHEHVNSVVHKPDDPIAPLHCTFGTGGAKVHKRERFRRNTFFDNNHGFAHVTIVDQAVDVRLLVLQPVPDGKFETKSWQFSSTRGLILNKLQDPYSNQFRETIIVACDKAAEAIQSSSVMEESNKQINYKSIDVMKRWYARNISEDFSFKDLVEDLKTLPRVGKESDFFHLLGFINLELRNKMLDQGEQQALADQAKKGNPLAVYGQISQMLIAKHQLLLTSRESKDDIDIVLQDDVEHFDVADDTRSRLSRSK